MQFHKIQPKTNYSNSSESPASEAHGRSIATFLFPCDQRSQLFSLPPRPGLVPLFFPFSQFLLSIFFASPNHSFKAGLIGSLCRIAVDLLPDPLLSRLPRRCKESCILIDLIQSLPSSSSVPLIMQRVNSWLYGKKSAEDAAKLLDAATVAKDCTYSNAECNCPAFRTFALAANKVVCL